MWDKKTIWFLWLIVLPLGRNALGQSAFLEIGYGSFQMTSIKKFQAGLQGQLDFDAKTVDEFPSYFTFKGTALVYEVNDLAFGFSIGQVSTGGRISYADFSGSIKIDNNLRGFLLGPVVEYNLSESNSSQFNLTLNPYVNFTKHSLRAETILLQEVDVTTVAFESTNYGLEGGFNYRHFVGNFFVQGLAGFNFDLGGKIKSPQNRNAVLADESGNDVSSNWSGYRVSLGIGMRLQ